MPQQPDTSGWTPVQPPPAADSNGWTPVQSAPPQEGFIKSAASALGIPTSIDTSQPVTPRGLAHDLWQSISGIPDNLMKSMAALSGRGFEEMGQPGLTSKAVGATHILESVLPGLGSAMAKSGDQLAAGNKAGATGTLVGASILPLIGNPEGVVSAIGEMPSSMADWVSSAAEKANPVVTKLMPQLVDGTPEQMMQRAVKAGKNNVDFVPALKTAMPNMKAAESDLGHPIGNLQDGIDAAKAAKKSLWDQYQQRLGPNGDATVDGNPIADKMIASIPARTRLQNPDLATKIESIANTYRRPLTLNEAEDFLQSTNDDLHAYYAKNKVGRSVAAGDPSTAYVVAEGDALRDALYGKLEELTGPGAREIKQQYGALTNVQNEMSGRKAVVDRQNLDNLAEQTGFADAAGAIGKGLIKMKAGMPGEGLADAAGGVIQSQWARNLKLRNLPDNIIARAFQGVKPANPLPPPVQVNVGPPSSITIPPRARGPWSFGGPPTPPVTLGNKP